MKRQKFKINKSSIILLICVFFYIVWYIVDGVCIEPDSASYINMDYSREPLYSILLAICRGIFGENVYLSVIVFLQCILAAVATWYFTMVVDKHFSLDVFSSGVIVGLQFAVVLLCRFAAGRKLAYCNVIGSEGIAIPLFMLFITELVLYIWNNKNKNLILCACYALGLLCTRKQMYIVILIMGCVFTLCMVLKQLKWKKYLVTLAVTILTFVCFYGIDMTYNWILRGEAMRNPSEANAFTVTTIYSSGVEEAEFFKDDKMQALFLDIQEQVEAEQYNYKYATGNWLDRYNHYADHFDLISYGIVKPAFYGFLEEEYDLSGNETALAFNELNQEVLRTLLPVRWKEIMKVAFCNILVGFANTVAKAHNLLNVYNLLFYIVYIGALMLGVIKKRDRKLLLLGITVLASVVINVVVVGFMIFAQSRYMIYNMSFMYVTMYLLIRDCALQLRNNKGE